MVSSMISSMVSSLVRGHLSPIDTLKSPMSESVHGKLPRPCAQRTHPRSVALSIASNIYVFAHLKISYTNFLHRTGAMSLIRKYSAYRMNGKQHR